MAASLGRIHLLTTTGLVYTYGTNDRSPQLATGLTIDPILCPVTNIDQLGCSSDWSYIVTTNNKLYISNTDTWTYLDSEVVSVTLSKNLIVYIKRNLIDRDYYIPLN